MARTTPDVEHGVIALGHGLDARERHEVSRGRSAQREVVVRIDAATRRVEVFESDERARRRVVKCTSRLAMATVVISLQQSPRDTLGRTDRRERFDDTAGTAAREIA